MMVLDYGRDFAKKVKYGREQFENGYMDFYHYNQGTSEGYI